MKNNYEILVFSGLIFQKKIDEVYNPYYNESDRGFLQTSPSPKTETNLFIADSSKRLKNPTKGDEFY